MGYVQETPGRVTEKETPEDEKEYRECCALKTRESVSRRRVSSVESCGQVRGRPKRSY